LTFWLYQFCIDKRYAVGMSDTNAGFSVNGINAVGTNWVVPRDGFR
jgi:hypothetical protein